MYHMKKLLLLSFLLPLLSFSGFDWINVDIDDRFSVKFPSQPVEKEMQGNPVWVSDINDDSRCMLMVFDFGKLGMDSLAVSEEMSTTTSFAEFRDGVLGQIEGASIISEKKDKVGGYMCFEFVIDMGKEDDNSLNIMYNKNIFVGSKMYSLSFYEKNNNPQAQSRNVFFRSILIK
jgi:hypothetical protein